MGDQGTVEPEALLRDRLPHVADLALPGAVVLGRVRADPRDVAEALGQILGDQLGHLTAHRGVSRGVDDGIDRDLRPVLKDNCVLGGMTQPWAGLDLQTTVQEHVDGAHVDVVVVHPGKRARENARSVRAEVQQVARFLEPVVVLRVILAIWSTACFWTSKNSRYGTGASLMSPRSAVTPRSTASCE